MHLYELAASSTASVRGAAPGPAAPQPVPEWALGGFRRRCITFFDGTEDTTTEVLWLQSHGLTADFRRRGSPPRAASLAAIGQLSEGMQARMKESMKSGKPGYYPVHQAPVGIWDIPE